jgi:hypothetical protein
MPSCDGLHAVHGCVLQPMLLLLQVAMIQEQPEFQQFKPAME